ncbi:glycosyltransferase, partial [candidate division KSB3 bacterium]|nr:glycosyltransferase [candidate division KSB3 bacterium]MBD3323894.1 glycosyltransferase [candidate division KSB3 bacterium]
INAVARVIAKIPDARVVMIGKAENQDYLASLQAQIQRLRLEAQVEWMAALPQTELAHRMRQADALVLPSLSEALGRVVIEAMATGTPVIGSRVGGIPELIADGKTGLLVPPGDDAALAEKMCWVAEHPDEIFQMGRQAYAFATKFFSEDIYVQGYAQLLSEAAKLLSQEQTRSKGRNSSNITS